jgi:ketosteroid isomerase-like protein
MSEENVEIVRRVTEIAEKSIPPWGEPGAGFDQCVAQGLISSNLEWRGGTRGGVGAAGLDDVAGREGFVQFIRTWIDEFDDFEVTYERIIDAPDDRVLVLTHMSGTGKESRAPVDLRSAQLYELEAGRVVRVNLFLDPDAAFKAAGLPE